MFTATSFILKTTLVTYGWIPPKPLVQPLLRKANKVVPISAEMTEDEKYEAEERNRELKEMKEEEDRIDEILEDTKMMLGID